MKSFDFDVGSMEAAMKLEAIKCAVESLESIAKSLETISNTWAQKEYSARVDKFHERLRSDISDW